MRSPEIGAEVLPGVGGVYAMRFREILDPMEKCHKEYWDLPKEERIARGAALLKLPDAARRFCTLPLTKGSLF